MSGIKPVELTEFYRWLRGWARERQAENAANGRGVFTPTELLARLIGCGRAHLCQVLSGKRPGFHTWPKIWRALPVAGTEKLKQCATWNAYLRRLDARKPVAKFAGGAT